MNATMTPLKVNLLNGEEVYTVRKAQILLADLLSQETERLQLKFKQILALPITDKTRYEKLSYLSGQQDAIMDFGKKMEQRLNKYMTI